MNVPAKMNAPASLATRSLASAETPEAGKSPSDGTKAASNSTPSNDVSTMGDQKDESKVTTAASPAPTNPVNEEPNIETDDEEVKLALEMALAASKNPNLSPEELHKLVGEKNKQKQIVQTEMKKKQEKAEEEAATGWDSWWRGQAGAVTALTTAAVLKAEEIKERRERLLYAEEIRSDEQIKVIRKQIKVLRKTLKAHKLQGNRVETRHVFKQQRLEKKLMQTCDKLEKQKRLLTETNLNVQEYAKAIIRASKKWRKKGTDDELKLEAQLCRNMHQMLTVEKQKSKLKKSTKEIKKYLQRCKSWLSDKQALCEMHLITLDVTTHSMKEIFEETIARQDVLIKKLKLSDEFKNLDISNFKSQFDLLPKDAGTRATLNALRGLPFTDSVRLKKEDIAKQNVKEPPPDPVPKQGQPVTSAPSPVPTAHNGQAVGQGQKPPPQTNNEPTPKPHPQPAKAEHHGHRPPAMTGPPQPHAGAPRKGQAPELYIEAKDDVSVSSRLSDPDEGPEPLDSKRDSDSDSGYNFGPDAPWSTSESHLDSVEEDEQDEKQPSAKAIHEDCQRKMAAKPENSTKRDEPERPKKERPNPADKKMPSGDPNNVKDKVSPAKTKPSSDGVVVEKKDTTTEEKGKPESHADRGKVSATSQSTTPSKSNSSSQSDETVPSYVSADAAES